MAAAAGVRNIALCGQVRTRHSQAVVAARIDHHVGGLRHVARHALGSGCAGLVEVMRWVVEFLRQVAATTQGVALVVKPQAVRLMTIAAGDSLHVHLALQERAINVDLLEDLAVIMVERTIQQCGPMCVQERPPVLVGFP